MNEFSKDVKMLAALQEEEDTGDRLLQAARRLAGAFSDLLQAAQPGTTEVNFDTIFLSFHAIERIYPFL